MNSFIETSPVPFPISDSNTYTLSLQPFLPSPLPSLNYNTISHCPKCTSCYRIAFQTICTICQSPLPPKPLPLDLISSSATHPLPHYEYSLPQDSAPSPTNACSYLFIIDLSQCSKDSTFLDTVINTLRSLIVSNSIPGESLTSVGFIGFDTQLYFFDVTRYPVIYTVSECIEDIFLPVPAHNLMVNLQDNYSNILYTLDIIQNFSGEISSSYTILPRCIESALRILDRNSLGEGAGKVMLFISDPKRSNLNTSRLETLRDYGIKLYQARIRCDMYVSANSYCDLESLSLVCRYCGGEVYYYPYLRRSKTTEKLAQEIKMNIMRETGWDCYIQVKVSNGWKIIQNYNGFRSLLNDRFSIPIINPDFTITYEIRNSRQTRLAVQAYLTYTSSTGIRKFRVMNYETTISPFPFPNPDILLSFYIKRAFNQSPSLSPSSYLLSLSQEISNSLSSLPNSSSFHSLIIYIASLLKHSNYFSCLPTNRGNHNIDDISPDLTSYYNYKLEFASVYASKLMSYPRLIGLHTGEWSRYLPVSRSSISNDGVYLLDNGIDMFIWIGKNYLWKRIFTGDTRTSVECKFYV